MLAFVLLLIPAATGCVAAATPWRRWIGWLCTASLGFVLVTGVVLAVLVVHRPALSAFGGVLRVDALSAFMVIVIARLDSWPVSERALPRA